MIRRPFAALTAVLLAVGLAACGSASNSNAEPLPSYGEVLRKCPGVRKYKEGGVYTEYNTALGQNADSLNCLLGAAKVPDSVKNGIDSAISAGKDTDKKQSINGRTYYWFYLPEEDLGGYDVNLSVYDVGADGV